MENSNDFELPGMWENADLIGGETDSSSALPTGYGAWQPIDTAPTEPGSTAIVTCPSIHEGEKPIVGEAIYGSDGFWYWIGYHDPICESGNAPTHWMPLPEAP